MSRRYPGSIISASRNITPGSSSGMWTVPQQRAELQSGRWQGGSDRIDRSVRLKSGTSYFDHIPGTNGNLTTWTFSAWIKRARLGTEQRIFCAASKSDSAGGNPRTDFAFLTNNTINVGFNPNGDNWYNALTSPAFGDVGSWYHVILAVDTTQLSSANRFKLYVNGELVTSYSSNTLSSIDRGASVVVNRANFIHRLGNYGNVNENPLDGYFAEVNFVDGLQLEPRNFGELDNNTGVWKPRRYTGTYGVNGFYLPFNDNATAAHLGLNRANLDSGDDYWANTNLLLKSVGTGGSQNNTFIDSSANNFTITRNGNVNQGTYTPFSDTGWSGYFDGSNDGVLLHSGTDNPDFHSWLLQSTTTRVGTIEAWIYLRNHSTPTAGTGMYTHRCILGRGATFMNFGVRADGRLRFYWYHAGTDQNWVQSSAQAIQLNTWHHIAASFYNGNCYLFIDGTPNSGNRINGGSDTGSPTFNGVATGTFSDGGFHWIGRESAQSATSTWDGYISNLRITSGTALYNSKFTPATNKLTAPDSSVKLLTLQDPGLRDRSSTNRTLSFLDTTSIQPFAPFASSSDYSTTLIGGSAYFDGSGDWLEIPDSEAFNFGSGEFTVEAWIYGGTGGGRTGSVVLNQSVSSAASNSAFYFGAGTDGMSLFLSTSGSSWTNNIVTSVPVGRRWGHVVWQRRGNTLEIYLDGVLQTVTGGDSSFSGTIFNSSRVVEVGRQSTSGSNFLGYISNLRVVKGSAVYTGNFTPSNAPVTAISGTGLLCNFTNSNIIDATGRNTVETVGNAQVNTSTVKYNAGSMAFDGTGDWLELPNGGQLSGFGTGPFTIEAWVKLGAGTSNYAGIFGNNHSTQIQLRLNAQGRIQFLQDYGGTRGNTDDNDTSGTNLRDNNWHHVAMVRNFDNTWALYVDGVVNYSGSGMTGNIQPPETSKVFIGQRADYLTFGNGTVVGNIEDLRVTKGIARYTGAFVPPERSFARTTRDIAHRQWHPVNLSVAAGVNNDSVIDSPTAFGTDTGVGGEIRSNYATLNPLDRFGSGTLSNGNLRFTDAGTNGWDVFRATIGAPSGKWYWEVSFTNLTAAVGCPSIAASKYSVADLPGQSNNFGVTYYPNGSLYKETGGGGIGGWGASYTTGDIIGIALDMDSGKVWFSKNGAWQASGNPAAGTNAASTTLLNYDTMWFPAVGTFYSGDTGVINFGQRPFAYTAPAGYKALCTENLPRPTIGTSPTTQPDNYFGVVTYAGTGSSQTINLGFQPDLIWIKRRNGTSQHVWTDSVRGAGKELFSSSTNAEQTDQSGQFVTGFNSNGFTLGPSATGTGDTNISGGTYVAWCWKAGDSTVTNNQGSVTSQVRANNTTGFSIISYAGSQPSDFTIGHGLNRTPSIFIARPRNAVSNWGVYYTVRGVNTNWAILNTQAVQGLNNGTLSGGAYAIINATNIQVSSSAFANGGSSMIGYCWAEIPGFSKFGSYLGVTAPNFIYTGFTPAFVMMKKVTGTDDESWLITTRKINTSSSQATTTGFNTYGQYLGANLNSAEGTTVGYMDIVSNGFVHRHNSGWNNTIGATMIYMAFAENPFNYARSR